MASKPAQLPDDVDALTQTREYALAKARYADRNWRLNTLYTIIDENSQKIPFRPNAAQLAYRGRRHARDAIAKARKLGFSTEVGVEMLDTCLWRNHITAGIIDATLDDARKKLAKIKFSYDNLSVDIRNAMPLERAHTELLKWKNGSSITVGTTYRGDTPQILHVSEFGKISVNNPEQASEIVSGALQAIPATGWCVVESTAHGRAGKFYEMVNKAQKSQQECRTLTALDFRLHFYGWWMKREYRLPNNLIIVPIELREYFKEVGVKLAQQGVVLDADQMAWYAQKFSDLGQDDTFSEFPTVIEECFYNSIKGAFWKDEIGKARREGRIGQPVSYDNSRRVNTMWDIGEDGTAIIFYQTDGLRFRYIDYYEEEGGSLQKCATVLEDKKAKRGFIYNLHIGPHDLEARDWANMGNTRKQTAEGLGIRFTVVPKVDSKADSIEAGRRLLNNTWIDEVHCKLLVERLENYRKVWNKALQVYSSEPVHDASSHPGDAHQQGSMYHGSTLDRSSSPPRDRARPKDRGKGSAWGA